jgi:hypothetical protein
LSCRELEEETNGGVSVKPAGRRGGQDGLRDFRFCEREEETNWRVPHGWRSRVSG